MMTSDYTDGYTNDYTNDYTNSPASLHSPSQGDGKLGPQPKGAKPNERELCWYWVHTGEYIPAP